MDICNSFDRQERRQIDKINKKKLFITIINVIAILIIFILMGIWSIYCRESVIQGTILIIQSLLYGYMYVISHKRKNLDLKNQQELDKQVEQQHLNNRFRGIYDTLLKLKHFEVYFLSLAATLYVNGFELMIKYRQIDQQTIIISLILSGFANIQSINSKQGNMSFGFITIIQLYTLLRVQLTYFLDIQSLTLNILLLIYQISYLKSLFTQKMKLKINQRTQKSKIELTMSLYQSILSIIPEGLAVINQDRKLLYANPTLKKILQTNKKNDILQILMNIGNHNKENEIKKNFNKSKTSASKREISNQIKNQQGIFLVKPPGSQNKKEPSDQQQNQYIPAQVEKLDQNEIKITESIDNYITQFIGTNLRADGIYNHLTFNGQKYNIIENEMEKQKISSENAKDQIATDKDIELSQKLEENRDSDLFINSKGVTLSNSCQIKSLQSICDCKGKAKQKDQFVDYNQKVKNLVNNMATPNKNIISQNNFYQGSENSEILSYQGFGISLPEVDLPIINQLPNVSNMNILKNEMNTIRANIDQDSILSISTPLKASQQNGTNRIFKNNIKIRQKQQNIADKDDLNQSNCSERQHINKTPNNLTCEPENQQDNNSLNFSVSLNGQNTTNANYNSKLYSRKKEKSFVKEAQNQQNIQMQVPNINMAEKETNIGKEITNNFTLKLKAKSRQFLEQITLNNIDNQIVTKKTDVADILNAIFEGSEMKSFENQQRTIFIPQEPLNNIQNQKETQNNKQEEQQEKKNEDNSKLKVPIRNQKRKQSFISQVKKQDPELNYLQQTDNIIKLQVKYEGRDLVLQFITVEYLTENLKNGTLVLIIVQDMWQDLLQKKMQDLQKDKMRIFASLSHELRTPLNCSISMLEVLRDQIQFTNPGYIEEFLNPALFSNKLLLNQINDILDFVQMDSGQFKYSFFNFSILGLLKDCQKLVSMQAQMKNIEIRIMLDQNVPESICSDPNRIRQIILNFLSNSLKFTKKGYIELGFKNIENGMYQLYVKDTGIGITRENLETIFNFCAKIKQEKKDEGLNAQGCGLGLTISNSLAKGLVNRKNKEGGIIVDSIYGEGSTFCITVQDMNVDEEGINPLMNQFSKSIPLQKLQKQSLNLNQDEVQKHLNNKNDTTSLVNYVKSQCSLNSSPTKYHGKKKQLNLINVSQIIFEDDHSYSDSPCKSQNPLSYSVNLKKSVFQNQNKKIIPDNSPNNFCQTGSTQQRFDSTAIVEDESEYTTKQYSQPHQFVQHHHNHSRFQEDGSCISFTKRQRINSPNYQSSQVKQLENFSSFTNDFIIRQGKTDTFYGYITDENTPSQKYNDNLAVIQQEDGKELKVFSAPTIEGQKKEYFISNSNNTSRVIKTINSFKTQNTDQFEKSKSFQEQEGFTSYVGYNNRLADSNQPQSSAFIAVEKHQLSSPVYHQQFGMLEISQIIDDKVLCAKDLDVLQINPHDLMNEIIKRNNIKKLKCKCPQIIIVDDNQFNLYALSKTIQQFSFSCLQISDELSVLEELQNLYQKQCCLAPKIIFMDIELPIKNGYEIATEINQYYGSIQINQTPVIIACTAYVGQEDREKAINSGMDDFINKPILKTAFQQLILNWSDLFV